MYTYYDAMRDYANARYAIQRISNGEVVEKVDKKEDAKWFLETYPEVFELIDIQNLSCVVVDYAEVGGPWGYGHQEESFRTYGSLVRCMINLEKFVQEYTRTFGPDPHDIYDYFRHCSLTVNGKDRTEWFHKVYTHKIDMHKLYI